MECTEEVFLAKIIHGDGAKVIKVGEYIILCSVSRRHFHRVKLGGTYGIKQFRAIINPPQLNTCRRIKIVLESKVGGLIEIFEISLANLFLLRNLRVFQTSFFEGLWFIMVGLMNHERLRWARTAAMSSGCSKTQGVHSWFDAA
ncbi:hypothetical protein Sjap_017949 [Stephania japonica]|uniref:Uncharacterized protein n=1 Tax=Stephania japonica TaxID=461633 RepID=A0AAP0I742_9MAGN